ncbi:MAG: hypothetical protein ACLPYS_13830, partial [Vulcanimicrobiaceae bacterium]
VLSRPQTFVQRVQPLRGGRAQRRAGRIALRLAVGFEGLRGQLRVEPGVRANRLPLLRRQRYSNRPAIRSRTAPGSSV